MTLEELKKWGDLADEWDVECLALITRVEEVVKEMRSVQLAVEAGTPLHPADPGSWADKLEGN